MSLRLLERLWPVASWGAKWYDDVETAHRRLLDLASSGLLDGLVPGAPTGAFRIGPIEIKGRVGLAAGFLKDGDALPFFSQLGFGSIEIGTVTPLSQQGNPRPRIRRFLDDGAIVNRMGFPSLGPWVVRGRLANLEERPVPIGINIGPNKTTAEHMVWHDFLSCSETLQGLADWFTLNVSSPNTAGLRNQQRPEQIKKIVQAALNGGKGTPVLVKLSPDEGLSDLRATIEAAGSAGAAGFIVGNTTVRRIDSSAPWYALRGGLSGAPLWPLARVAVGHAIEAAAGLPVVGCGGIFEPAQARELIDMGCASVQIFSSFALDGPRIVREINEALHD